MLKQFLMACCGIVPAKAAPSVKVVEQPWVLELRRAGYIVFERHGVWHWYHPPSGASSGRYTTEHGALVAAKLDHDEWKDQQ